MEADSEIYNRPISPGCPNFASGFRKLDKVHPQPMPIQYANVTVCQATNISLGTVQEC